MGNYASDLKNARRYALKLSRNTDADIIDHLDNMDNVQGYIKGLIRADIEKGETGMKLYEGYTNEGTKVDIVLEDGHIWIVNTASGEREQYNDEWYSEDDTSALAQIKASMISEGFRF